jgi:hypothetical protein
LGKDVNVLKLDVDVGCLDVDVDVRTKINPSLNLLHAIIQQ